MTVLKRYLLAEFAKALGMVTAVLSTIVVGRLLLVLLSKVAKGKFTADLIAPLLGLGAVRSLIILLPLTLLLSLTLAIGRMYRDNEITVLRACGLSEMQLFRPLLPLILSFVALIGLLSISVAPWSERQAQSMTEHARQRVDMKNISPGRFNESPLGNWIVYVQQADKERAAVENVFIHSVQGGKPLLETAVRGRQVLDPRSGQQALILNEGFRYEGRPGSENFKVVEFKRHITRIPDWKEKPGSTGIKEAPTSMLIGTADPAAAAELQWRISTPLSALLLSLLAFPLSYTTPRQGRYAKLIFAVVAYLVYINLLLVSVNWIERGKLSPSLGAWWVHVLMMLIAIALIFREHRPRWNLFRRHESA